MPSNKTEVEKIYQPIKNYIYLYHTDTFLIIPTYPENIQDGSQAVFTPSTPMGRSAPIMSYNHSGPRSIQVQFKLHRDMMNQVNYNVSNADLDPGDDYVDAFIKQIQAASLPSYVSSSKMVDPPQAALRVSPEIFIKGVVDGNVGVVYNLPILKTEKYAMVDVSFQITEVDPYGADDILSIGSNRTTSDIKLSMSLTRNLYSIGSSSSGRINY